MRKLFHFFNILIALSLVASLFMSFMPAEARTGGAAPLAHQQMDANAPYVPGEVVVFMAGGKKLPNFSIQAQKTANTVGARITRVSETGSLLLSLPANADVKAAAASLQSQAGVAFAEPNYIYSLPDPAATSASISGSFNSSSLKDYEIRSVKPSKATDGKDRVAVPIEALQSMRRVKADGKIAAVYPNDPYLWWNGGWSWVGAGIVSPNATASANICEIDTGVDYTHPDLIKQTSLGPVPMIVKGYDFVNNDADPMDDNGHGTHVAGIMVAVANNKQGIAGVSTGKVVAVKALTAQGFGTNFDISRAINFCANRTDIKVINMSLGGPESAAIETAVDYAVNTKGKLLVAAAGNAGADMPTWPAFFANNDVNGSAACAPTCSTYPSLTGKVLAVAADGYTYESSPGSGYYSVDYGCMAPYSNYGSWVSVAAPGTWIYSTTPWDKTFWMNSNEGVNTRFDSLSGTSMATPFVAAAAARRWGYKPLENNTQVAYDVSNYSPSSLDTAGLNEGGGACWPSSMSGKFDVNVADLLNRGGLSGSLFDASTGLPLNGATISAYQGTALRGSAVITPYTWTANPIDQNPDPKRIYMGFNQWTDIINLPVGGPDLASYGFPATPYVIKAFKAGYTASPQPVFQQVGVQDIWWGWNGTGFSAIPPKSANFDFYTGWWMFYGYPPAFADADFYNNPADLDSNVWIPNVPNPQDASQFYPFIAGPEGNTFGFGPLEGDPTGALGAFPFARWKYDGGVDRPCIGCGWVRTEDITVQNRKPAHSPLLANAALPYYPGNYTLMVTDYGQTIDQDSDGCGNNYGYGFNPSYDNTCAGIGTPGIPLLGVYMTPWVYVWKDGVIKAYVPFNGNTSPVNPGDPCNAHWWKALTITSGLSGAPTITVNNQCGDAYPGTGAGIGGGIQPYYSQGYTGQMGILNTQKGK